MTYNIRGIKSVKEELEHYLNFSKSDSAKPDILALQETFLTKKTYRCRIPGYTCIEAKADHAKGGTGLLLAVKNNVGLEISEFKAAPTWLSGIVSGRTKNGDKFTLLVTNVHFPNAGIRKKRAISELLDHYKKSNKKFKKHILLGDYNMDTQVSKKFTLKLGTGFQHAKVVLRYNNDYTMVRIMLVMKR
ncbi:hypothetical protein AYI70_g11218 [Smittium culicis]|uniref:Endonuclease/exonuclease/phosphatase domain-containing protein n=1 Tax=Smittium culicis TaxID=133412 RepID=A0A1R1X2V4_9FUNG|nr:hypothetical protein AYI70_g11218 [Smittium culicis]